LTKIAFIGAGSVVFTKNLLTDVFKFPELRGTTVALHDIDPERLETAGMMARWTSGQLGAGATVEEHLDRRAALDEADLVVNMVQIGVIERPTEKPWGLREMQIRDPDGLIIVIVEVPETYPLRRR
jgi:alpha-galactosidase